MRPFDVRRDLAPVADLVEQCFADTLDPDGERYLEQMRAASRNPGFLHFAAAASEWSSVPLSGYVWEEDGKVVGNISLIPFALHNQRNYLIANVATHPAYRRRGIARSLTAQAVEHARRYAYLFFFRFMLPFPAITTLQRGRLRFNFERLDDLRPGSWPEIDLICRAILDGTPFIRTTGAA